MILKMILAGMLATAVMDLTTAAGSHTGWIRKPKVSLLGRWLLGLMAGRLMRQERDIRFSDTYRHEAVVGFFAHYLIGISLTSAFLFFRQAFGWPNEVWRALLFGLTTNAFPWLIMFPSMGFGLCAMKSPPEAKLFLTSLIGHAGFGLGVWFGGFF